MELKDLIGLIFTVVAVILFRSLSSGSKKQPPKVVRRDPTIMPRSDHKMGKKLSPSKIVPTAQVQPQRLAAAPTLPKTISGAKASSKKLFQDKGSLKKGFIIQEILKRPYE